MAPKISGRVILDLRDFDGYDDLGRHIEREAYACPAGAEITLIVRKGQFAPVLRHVKHLGGIEVQSDDATVVASWIGSFRSWGIVGESS